MARYSGKKQISEETQNEAMRLAKGTQSPGQTKAQTKLIAQGIERGIDLYKKEHKEKTRALDRRQREKRQPAGPAQDRAGVNAADRSSSSAQRQHWLPWLLLGLTWAGIGAFWLLNAT